jgi:hypothetical protein
MNRFSLNNIVGSEYWVNSSFYSFKELVDGNPRLPKEWQYSNLKRNYDGKIIKPINGYAEIFSKKPKVVESFDGYVLRQSTHAEIWVEPLDVGIYALDKCWQRQFYPSDMRFDIPLDCYQASYRFYTPWIIDQDISFEIREVTDSPFKILKNDITFNKVDYSEKVWNPAWIYFSFKKDGDHKKVYDGEEYCMLPIETPVYDIIIKDTDLLEKIMGELNE